MPDNGPRIRRLFLDAKPAYSIAEAAEVLGMRRRVVRGWMKVGELEVRLPRLEVVALERVAAREGRSVSAVLSRELIDFVSVHSAWLSEAVPGFAVAFEWPEARGEL